MVRPSPSAVRPDGAARFAEAFGEDLRRVLDLRTWAAGDAALLHEEATDQEVASALAQAGRLRTQIRTSIFPFLAQQPGSPPCAGVYAVSDEEVARVTRDVLAAGRVQACDGTCAVFDSLPVTIVQLGVVLVSYAGELGAWGTRLYRRDLRRAPDDAVEELRAVLAARADRGGVDTHAEREDLSDLARRGLMTAAERAVLVREATAPWRMGHGNPCSWELLTGASSDEVLATGIGLVRALVEHGRFLFVPSAAADRPLLTVGDALDAQEYAVVGTQERWMTQVVERGHYRGRWSALLPAVRRLADEVGRQVVVGVYRATAEGPAQVFYAHADHAHEAATIAIADSLLQPSRNFPALIDVADHLARAAFPLEALNGSARAAYARAGHPFAYLPERDTRPV